MNAATLLILLADMSDKILVISGFIAIAFGILSTFAVIFPLIQEDGVTERFVNNREFFFTSLLIALAIFIITPSSRTIYIAAGVNVTNELLQTETANKAIKLLNQKLDEALGEAK